MGDDELQRLTEERTAASDMIVNSDAPKRLTIEDAGGGKGLALTFIRNLVADLGKDLGTLADAFTFHGYCKQLMHKHDVAGLAAGDYYPPLLELVGGDLLIVWVSEVLRYVDHIDLEVPSEHRLGLSGMHSVTPEA
jgi:hypothetical protein